MNSRHNGIALIELLIIVILVSTLATAYWNFYLYSGNNPAAQAEYSPIDSIAYDILDEITLNMRQARFDSLQGGNPITISHNADSDEIDIRAYGKNLIYYVNDKNFLIKNEGTERRFLLGEVNTLKAVRLGSQTLLITIIIGHDSGQGDSNAKPQNYSRVVTVNSIL